MKKRKFVWFLVLSLIASAVVFALNTQFGKVPALGEFLNPFKGVWKLTEKDSPNLDSKLELQGLNEVVSIYYDERYVPHIFAENDEDLAFAQGFVQAQFRLWQMEFYSLVGAGRLSEVVGKKLLDTDRSTRRHGVPMAAKKAAAMMVDDKQVGPVLDAFTKGVNAYIDQMSPNDLPIEYRLLGYKPEHWSPYKTALVMKNMATSLSSFDWDIKHMQAIKVMEEDLFYKVYRNFWPNDDPVVPNFGQQLKVRERPAPSPLAPTWTKTGFYDPMDKYIVGSNNWAVSGSKTQSGNPMLAGDPHLQLGYPSIWIEMHLNSPSQNVYGVTIPGAPGIVIGYNDHFAWSLTNSGRDARDWFEIQFKDESRDFYWYEGGWKESTKVVEEIKIKGEKTFIDTVVYTHHGPVYYDQNFGDLEGASLASTWTAHYPSNEAKTFINLNRGKSYEDYRRATTYFNCPQQNIVFASTAGDIAITHAGLYPILPTAQTLFVMDGSKKENDWTEFIPRNENPFQKNPERGFVSSANQVQTDSLYRYPYTGNFEHFRNRRINQELEKMTKANVNKMTALQMDNYSMLAAEGLPKMLSLLDDEYVSRAGENALEILREWDYMFDADQQAPVIFEEWWEAFYQLFWEEILKEGVDIAAPKDHMTLQALLNPDDYLDHIDKIPVHPKDLGAVVSQSFQVSIEKRCGAESCDSLSVWSKHVTTKVRHLARIDAFSDMDLETGGNTSIVNATREYLGPSWRMVVDLSTPPKGYGVYPGGVSGNPASKFYNHGTENWTLGKYFELNSNSDPEYWKTDATFKQTMKP